MKANKMNRAVALLLLGNNEGQQRIKEFIGCQS